MKVTLESTTKTVTLNGVPARIWEGKTEGGVALHAFITRIAVDKDVDCSQFETELRECVAPSADVAAYSARLLL